MNEGKTRESERVGDETAIRSVIEAVNAAMRNRDVEAMVRLCAPDFVAFDLVMPLEHVGADNVRQLWARTLADFQPPIEASIEQLSIVVDGPVAFSHSLHRLQGVNREGERKVQWLLCLTVGYRKLDGQWRLIHQHTSLPQDIER